MTAKTKIILQMGATLIVGVAIGAMLHRTIAVKRIRNIMEMRAAGRFVPGLQAVLDSATPEQAPKIREAFEKHRIQLAEIHKQFGKEIEAAMEDFKKEVEPLLTPEQKRRFETKFPGPPPFLRRAPGGFPMGGRPFPGEDGLEGLKDRLKLSDDQLAKIKDIFSRYRRPAEPRPWPGPGQGPGQPGPGSAFAPDDLAKMEAEIENVLTAEQKAEFRRIRDEGRRPPFDEPRPPLPE